MESTCGTRVIHLILRNTCQCGTVYRFFLQRHEGTGLLGRPRDRKEDDIKMDLKVIGRERADCINLADTYKLQAVVTTVMTLCIRKIRGIY